MSKPLLLPSLAYSQLVSWGTLYYAFAVLAPAMQTALGASASSINGAFSLSLLVWGLSTYPAGLAAQRYGARSVLLFGALLTAALFLLLYGVESLAGFYITWALLGIAMAMTLYEPAFAVIVQSFSNDHRRRIGWITVVGGLASTTFWPLGHLLGAELGWRNTFVVFSCMHLLAGLLLVRWLPVPHLVAPDRQAGTRGTGTSDSRLILLTGCFAIYGFVTTAIAIQVIPSLRAQGLNATNALLLASLIGPMQVIGRGADLLLAGRWASRRIAILTFSLLPLSFFALWFAYWYSILNAAFIIAYGAGLGLLTIVRATAPLEFFGPNAYARNGGALNVPWVLARAAGPIGSIWILEVAGDERTLIASLAIMALLGSTLYLSTCAPVWRRV